LLDSERLVKPRRFGRPEYVGDPVNALTIFNAKEVDEIAVLDITATLNGRGPNLELIERLTSECFMPLLYGGGVADVAMMGRLLKLGVEKVCFNSRALTSPETITAAAKEFGSQAVVVSMDVRRSLIYGERVYAERATRRTEWRPVPFAKAMESAGAGELLVTAVNCEGVWCGFDCLLTAQVAAAVSIPVIASGGCGSLRHVTAVLEAGASACVIGSMAVFQGKDAGVLIGFPSSDQVRDALPTFVHRPTSVEE
jgi:cyclase